MEKESASPLNANERNSKRAKSMGHSGLEMTGATGENETSGSGLSSKPPSAPQKHVKGSIFLIFGLFGYCKGTFLLFSGDS